MAQKKRFTSPIIAGLGSVVMSASLGTALASSGHLLDSAGNVITSGSGECVQTGAWSQDLSTPECDPALAARLQAERAAELAAVEPSIPKPTLLRLSDKRNVMFEFNSATLTPVATEELDRLLGKIREFDEIDTIDVVGHTDSTGPENYYRSLSEQRAASVSQFLESRGVRASLLSTQGEGEANPVADNTTREGRAMNRRVDILISGSIVE